MANITWSMDGIVKVVVSQKNSCILLYKASTNDFILLLEMRVILLVLDRAPSYCNIA